VHDSMVPKEVNLSKLYFVSNPSEMSGLEVDIKERSKDCCVWGHDALRRREV